MPYFLFVLLFAVTNRFDLASRFTNLEERVNFLFHILNLIISSHYILSSATLACRPPSSVRIVLFL